MHKLPTALKCYGSTNKLQTTIDSKFTAIELALSTKFTDHEAKFNVWSATGDCPGATDVPLVY